MKKYMLLSLFALGCPSTLLQAETDKDKMFRAIENSDVRIVRGFLSRLQKNAPLTEADKKAFIEAADEVIEEKKEQTSLLRSRLDLAKLLIGGALVGAGGFFSFYFLRKAVSGHVRMADHDQDARNAVYRKYGYAAGCCLAAGAGLYSMIKGYYCDTAYGRLKIARQVKDVLEAKKDPKEGDAQKQPVNAAKAK